METQRAQLSDVPSTTLGPPIQGIFRNEVALDSLGTIRFLLNKVSSVSLKPSPTTCTVCV